MPNNWTFPGYEKIAESADRWRLDEKGWRALRKERWVVTEKIHGANFCLATDGSTVRCASRREWLAEQDAFFGWQKVRDALTSALSNLFDRITKKHPETVRLYVYGELFGGRYPHPEAWKTAGVQPIQTGVWYTPDIRFCAFDIRIEAGERATRYLDYAEALKQAREAGFLCAEPLFIGGYEAAMDYPVRFDTTLPRRLGLPPLPPGTNFAEGVVIKPCREVVVHNTAGDPIRPVLKRKIPEFAEDRRFHEA